MAVYIALGILIGIIVGVVGLLIVSALYLRHEEKKKKKAIESFFKGFAEGLMKSEDDGK